MGGATIEKCFFKILENIVMLPRTKKDSLFLIALGQIKEEIYLSPIIVRFL